MKSVEQILVVLESLSPKDRHWIVARLPDNAKSLLMNQLSNPNARHPVGADDVLLGDKTAAVKANNNIHSDIERISPAVAAKILANEPIWIVVAILQSVDATWTARVIQALPTSIRPMVMAMQYDSSVMPLPIVASLRNTLLRYSAMNSDAFTRVEVQPRWRQWLDAIWTRSAA